jgi:hypothetical protein
MSTADEKEVTDSMLLTSYLGPFSWKQKVAIALKKWWFDFLLFCTGK